MRNKAEAFLKIPATIAMQKCVRHSSEALFAKKIIIGEGATEVGLCRALDTNRIEKGKDSMSYLGVQILDGTGNTAVEYAKTLNDLGFKIAFLCDSDETNTNTKKQPLKDIGVECLIIYQIGLIMTDLNLFLSQCQSMIVAPAGYGKTHSIAECINICSGQKTCLILTHTHAGIASLKEKLQSIQSSNSNYELATICGFTLNIAQAYHQDRKDFPDIENSPNDYYRFAIETSIRILKAKPIYSTLQLKYSHVIVDEYQDCSILQHKFIKVLSQYIPTHILGDPLQSIFKFDGACADLNDIEQMEFFFNNKQTLETPWRWKKNKCDGLGNDLKNIREKLENNKIINIDEYKNISTLYADSGSLYQHGTLYSKLLWREIFNNQSLLVIHPKSESKNFRLKIIKSYPKLRLIEAIDDKDFYTYSSAFDSANKKNILALILRLSRKVFKKTVIDNWFNNSDKLKTKRNINDKAISLIIKNYIGILERDINPINIYNLLYYIHHLPENACYRTELMNDIYKALKKAQTDKITISDAIKQNRDILRQIGRKVEGRCIGTTLLTKGLEFDTVVVLNFQEFEDRNNFYVAITRACKKLILIGNTHNIHFNNFSSE